MNKLLIETRLFEGKVNEDDSGRTIVKGILQILIRKSEW